MTGAPYRELFVDALEAIMREACEQLAPVPQPVSIPQRRTARFVDRLHDLLLVRTICEELGLNDITAYRSETDCTVELWGDPPCGYFHHRTRVQITEQAIESAPDWRGVLFVAMRRLQRRTCQCVRRRRPGDPL